MRFVLFSLLSLNLMAADKEAETSGAYTQPLTVMGGGSPHTSPASGGASTLSLEEGEGVASRSSTPLSGGSGVDASGEAAGAIHLSDREDLSIKGVISRMKAHLLTLPEFAHPEAIEPAAEGKSISEQSRAIHLFHHVTDILGAMDDILKLNKSSAPDAAFGLVGYIDCRLVALTTRKLMPDFESRYGSTFDRDRYDMLLAVQDDPWNKENDYHDINDRIAYYYPGGRP